MQYGGYPTPNDVKIFIKGTWIDDAYRIDIDKQAKKIPLTGYHQREFKLVAMGKKIVVGNIIIHWRFPGYLNYAIKKVLRERQDGILHDASITSPGASQTLLRPPGSVQGGPPISPGDSGDATREQLPDTSSLLDSIRAVKRMTVEERVRFLMASHEKGYFNQASVILDEIFARGVGTNVVPSGAIHDTSNPEDIEPDDYEGGHRGFDMDLYYGYTGTRQQGVYVTETVKGVHIIGRRKVINASTSGGDLSQAGQSVLEVYPFFASDVVAKLHDTPPQFVT